MTNNTSTFVIEKRKIHPCSIFAPSMLYHSEGEPFLPEGFDAWLFRSGVALFVTTLAVGHTQSATPLEALGVRPIGNGLWSWLRHFLTNTHNSRGCLGYDPILGAWSPLARLFFHISAVLLLWSLLFFVGGFFTDDCCPVPGVLLGIYSVAGYGYLCHWMHRVLPNVSFPGGPREHKIQRIPAWPDQTSQIAETKNWRCAVAHDAHAVTDTKFEGTPNKGLTGERFGRQMWTQRDRDDTSDSKGWFSFSKNKVDENLVETMACGGRKPGFNASENPNR